MVNGKIYVGVHKTKNFDDGYMGSGKVIGRAIKRYGIENFEKVILETFENSEAMYAREKEIVSDEFLSRDDVYNLRRGGTGGFEYITKIRRNGFCIESNASNAARKSNMGKGKFQGKSHSYESRAKLSDLNSADSNPMFGKTHSEDTKAKMRSAQSGDRNSQFGSCWIFSEKQQKTIKIKKDILQTYLDQGWSKGRKCFCP